MLTCGVDSSDGWSVSRGAEARWRRRGAVRGSACWPGERVSGEKEKEKGSWAVGAGLGQGEWCWAVAWGLGRSVKELAREGKRENGPQWRFMGRTGFGLETGLGFRCWVCWDLRFGPLLLFFSKHTQTKTI